MGFSFALEKGTPIPGGDKVPGWESSRQAGAAISWHRRVGQQKVKACIRRHRPSLDAWQHELPQHAVGIGARPTTLTGHQTMANRHRAGCYEAGNDCDASELDSRAAGAADEGLVDTMSTGAGSVWGDGHPSTTCDSDCHARTPLQSGSLGVQVFAYPPLIHRFQ